MNTGAIAWQTQVRVYECDALGHVNNAVWVSYLEQATSTAWVRCSPAECRLRSLTVEYLAPAYVSDELIVRGWPVAGDEGHMTYGYAVQRRADNELLLRARLSWSCPKVLMESEQPAAEALLGSEQYETALPRPLNPRPDHLGAHSFSWQHTVRHYELDSSGYANPAEILRWLEEAKFAASAAVGWPVARMLAADFVTVQVRHDTQFLAELTAGDRIQIVSKLYDLRRVKGTWLHEVYRDDQLVAKDYSIGAFLNRSGRPSPAPPAMLADLMAGEP